MGQVGIFPGAFDPVHNGHIGICELALDAGLDKVVLLPERHPRFKKGVTDFGRRLEMLKLAVAENPKLEVAELPDEQFSTQDTLPELRERFGAQLTLLIGSDVAKSLPKWEDVDVLLRAMGMIVALRGDDKCEDVGLVFKGAGLNSNFQCISSPEAYVASSKIRAQGVDDRARVHPRVRSYVTKHNLYS